MSTTQMKTPHCVGEYEAQNLACDGNIRGRNRQERAACYWRDRCAAFQQHLVVNNAEVEDFIEIRREFDPQGDERFFGVAIDGYNKFIKMCDLEIRRWKVSQGIVRRTPSAYKRAYRTPAQWHQNRARKALAARQNARRAEAMKLVEHFKEMLLDELPGYEFATGRVIIRAGHLYLRDRWARSKYLSCYCRAEGGRDISIAMLWPRPATLTLDIGLPVKAMGLGMFSKKFVKKLDAQPLEKKGRFLSIVLRADKERIAMAAEVLGRLCERGEIMLPPPKR